MPRVPKDGVAQVCATLAEGVQSLTVFTEQAEESVLRQARIDRR